MPGAAEGGAGVDSDCGRAVHPPQRRPADAETGVQLTLRIGKDRPPPPHRACDHREPAVIWAEPDQDEPDAAGVGSPVVLRLHLDQVLLAGQSMPVAHEHHELHSRAGEADPAGLRRRQVQVVHPDAHPLGSRHLPMVVDGRRRCSLVSLPNSLGRHVGFGRPLPLDTPRHPGGRRARPRRDRGRVRRTRAGLQAAAEVTVSSFGVQCPARRGTAQRSNPRTAFERLP